METFALICSIFALVVSLVNLYLIVTKDKPRHDVPKEQKAKKTIYRWKGNE